MTTRHGTWFLAAVLAVPLAAAPARAADSFTELAEKTNQKMVKVFGAGGFSRLNNYGTGIIISSEGHILTVASQLLDTSDLVVHLYDGQRLKAQVLAVEPELDAAIIKIRVEGKKIDEPNGLNLAYFDFAEAAKRPHAETGDWVLALTNTFEIALRDEPLSLQRGVVMAYTKLAGRRGVFEFPYTGDVYVVDAITNNPGAGGGAIINRKGELLGVIGREIKNSLSDTWMNYAIPVTAKVDIKVKEKDKDGKEEEKTITVTMPEFVAQGMQGKYRTVTRPKTTIGEGGFHGIVFVPNVLDRTPAFVEDVVPGSPAAKAGFRPDDLVSFVDGEPIASINAFNTWIKKNTRSGQVLRVEVRRGEALHTIELKLGGTAGEGGTEDAVTQLRIAPGLPGVCGCPRQAGGDMPHTITHGLQPMIACLTIRRLLIAVAAAVVAAPTTPAADVNEVTEKAMKAAAAAVAPTVVKIETTGGAEVVGGGKKGPGGGTFRKGTGPTTGLIVGADGFIITSAFNFANKPASIFVTIPGRSRIFAKVVATDQTRMLTLLKVDAKDLPVPAAFPKAGIEVGHWSLALGRTSDPDTDHPPSMSVGIVSATNRIWGKAIQTDAKTSPVNYGGPLVALTGQVYGVIVPASNRAEGETAGVDVYDGGIGFAVPLEDILAVLPRLKQGHDLKRGLLGINPQGTDVYNASPVVGAIQPDSAAAHAGMKVGDKILEVDGKKIPNFSTLQHVLGPKYDGDEVTVKVMRGAKEHEFKSVKLLGTATAHVSAFLGLLPMRDDPGPGVEIRYVYPKSPADLAGLKVGDRVMKLAPATVPTLSPVQNRATLIGMLQRLTPGTEVKIEVKRKDGDKVETVTAKLVPAPDALPEKVPLPSSAGKALEGQPKPKGKEPKEPFPPGCGAADEDANDCGEEKKDEKKDEKKGEKKDEKPKVETGFLKRTNEALGREYWVYVPEKYDANKSYGVIVWFHDTTEGSKDGEKVSRTFREVCEDHNFIMVGPKAGNKEGWVPSETEIVMQDVKTVLGQYTTDKTRVVAHGQGNGGQMAFYVGFNARDVIRGVGTVGAVLGTNPKENVANQPLSFFISGGDKDPLLKEIKESKELLVEKRFPVVFREMKESGKEYFDSATFADFIAWLDSLDRI